MGKTLAVGWPRNFTIPAVAVLLLVAGGQDLGAAPGTPGSAPRASEARTLSPPQEVEKEAERMRAARRAEARWLSFYTPFYSIEDGFDTTVFLMNTISDPISVTATALAEGGNELSLGSFTVESLHHLEISLRDHLAGFEGDFGTGSLRFDLLGDPETLQGWTVVRSMEGSSFEIPLATPEDAAGNHLVAFWDQASVTERPARDVVFYLLNTASHVVHGRATSGHGEERRTLRFEIDPGQRLELGADRGSLALPGSGFLELSHDGEPGDLLGIGLTSRAAPDSALTLYDTEVVRGRRLYESIPLPRLAASAGQAPGPRAAVTLYSRASERQEVLVDVLDALDGSSIARKAVPIDAGQIRTVPLGAIVGPSTLNERSIRLRIEAQEPSLLVQGGAGRVGGPIVDLAFFALEDVHHQGTYPLPDIRRYETVTSLVNVGDEEALVGAQVYWDGGTYALGPLVVPAGGLRRIELERFANEAEPDVLGRTLDKRRPGGVLKWTVIKGSDELIGRTEVRPRTGDDRFGFNCWGCCWEMATASIVPGLVEFTLGESRAFTSCLTYSDCSGTMGPYPVTPQTLTVPSPFSWDGATVTASSAADAELDFGVQFAETSANCTVFLRWLLGFGRAELCQETFNPNDYKYGPFDPTCSQQTGPCIECYACCENIAQELLCKGKKADIVLRDRDACREVCTIDKGCGT